MGFIERYDRARADFDSVWTLAPTNTALGDESLVRIEASAALDERFLDELTQWRTQNGNETSLTLDDRITLEILLQGLQTRVGNVTHRGHLLPIDGWWDHHATFAELPVRTRVRSVTEAEAYLDRLRAWPAYNRQFIARLEEGLVDGWVRPRSVFEAWLPTVTAHLVEDARESRFMQPLLQMSQAILTTTRDSLLAIGLEVVADSVLTGYLELAQFIERQYVPGASQTEGIGSLAGGEAYYSHLIRAYTTLDLSADEIHRIGLSEVARIRSDMMGIVAEEGYGEDFQGYVEHLRTDPRYYASTPEQLLEKTALVLKRMDGRLPELFEELPSLPYGIIPVPDYLAPQTTTAYYSGGSWATARAGNYAVNTYDLASRPLYEVESLSFHEAVPGHHLQIAYHQELAARKQWPAVRRNAGFTAYTEGWALYAETLGAEVGFYTTPSSRFGRLSYDMWRALRLVVDTGIHTKGWSRERAVDYMAANSALSLRNIRNEVDRYIFWPGQALAYKLGELEIQRLRRLAEQELGEQFDLRGFHSVILGHGNIPLSMLEPLVREWLEREKAERGKVEG